MVDVEPLYRQHLPDADQRLLSRVAGRGRVPAIFSDERLEAAVFADGARDGGFVDTSPFLSFAVAVHRTAARLDHASYVEEPWTGRQRIPVFDVIQLRELLADPARCFFLVELLASYTHVASGVTWERTRRGWRRRRFSELDPVGLAGLLDVVDPAERPGVYRRLGDLALFLTGVFPDHTLTLDLGGVAPGPSPAVVWCPERGRLVREREGAPRVPRTPLLPAGGRVGPGPRGSDDQRSGRGRSDQRAVRRGPPDPQHRHRSVPLSPSESVVRDGLRGSGLKSV
jgi:hypothetical protein